MSRYCGDYPCGREDITPQFVVFAVAHFFTKDAHHLERSC
jgi:hypothetical protein